MLAKISCFAFMLVLLFSACQKKSYVDRVVKNNTAEPIFVRLRSGAVVDYERNIPAFSSDVVMVEEAYGRLERAINPADNIDTFLIINANGDTLRKDWQRQAFWETQIEQTSRMPASHQHTYTFTVETTDF
jgi:hypothetical protein